MKGSKHKPYFITPISAYNAIKQDLELKEARRLKPDCVEWRADAFSEIIDNSQFRTIVNRIRNGLDPSTELLVTLKGSSLRYLDVAESIKEIDYIDIDINEYHKLDMQNILNDKHVLSYHSLKCSPPLVELEEIVSEMMQHCNTVKVAVKCQNQNEVSNLFSLHLTFPNLRLITVPIGKNVSTSRLVAHKFGSVATFASLLNPTGEGQIPYTDMKYMIKQMK